MSDEYTLTTQGEITPDVEALHMIIGLGNFEATGSTGGNTYDLAQRIIGSDWLEAHDREVAARALEDAADSIYGEWSGGTGVQGLIRSEAEDWLRVRAAAVREGATS